MKIFFRSKKNVRQAEAVKVKQETIPQEYERLFIKRGKVNVRQGKAIYIRPEFHRTIARIVQTIGDRKVNLTDYVDNVFAHHFKQYEQEIKESFTKNNEPIL